MVDIKNKIKDSVGIIDLVKRLGITIYPGDFIKSIYTNETKASLKIYPKTNSFYCFSTGEGGDIFKFYADYKKLTFKNVLSELSEMYLKNNIKNKPNKKNTDITLLESEKEIFEERLSICLESGDIKRDAAVKIAEQQIRTRRSEIQNLVYESMEKFCYGLDDESLNYLTGKERGLNENIIKGFRLFSIKDHKQTVEFLKSCFNEDELKISGLFGKEDKFLFGHHKIIIPFLKNGKINFLRGRYLFEGNSKPDNCGKYMGLYNFAGNLTTKRFFNSDIIKYLIPGEQLLICEGEFDTMIATQCGYCAVGILGTQNFPDKEINRIKNCDIYLSLDNDASGQKAIQKIVELFNKPIKVLKLKKHKDLTELING